MEQRKLKVGVLLLGTFLTVLVLLSSWVVATAQTEGAPPVPLTPAADSVTFTAPLQAGEKTPEVVGQYAYTYVRGVNGEEHSLLSGYSEDPQPRQTATWSEVDDGRDHEVGEVSYGTGCVHGGDTLTTSCGAPEDAASASTREGYMDEMLHLAELLGLPLGLLTPPNMGAKVSAPLGTEARCAVDETGTPQLHGARPTGTVSAGAVVLLGAISNADHYDLETIVDDAGNELRSGVLTTREKFNFALLGPSYVNTRITLTWGVDEVNLRAFSEAEISYQGEVPQLGWESPWETHVVRSECGLKLSDGRGSDTVAGPGQGAAPLQVLARALRAEPEVTSAPGSPQSTGFTTEDTLSHGTLDYHLLATRELDSLDRLIIAEVLAEIAESGEVEGDNWKLFAATAAGELVPVIEIVLADGAIVQVRPMVEGVVMPTPDLVESPAPSTTTTTTTLQSTEPATTQAEPTTPAESTTQAEPTTQEAPTTPAEPTTSASPTPEPGEDTGE